MYWQVLPFRMMPENYDMFLSNYLHYMMWVTGEMGDRGARGPTARGPKGQPGPPGLPGEWILPFTFALLC